MNLYTLLSPSNIWLVTKANAASQFTNLKIQWSFGKEHTDTGKLSKEKQTHNCKPSYNKKNCK